MSRQHAEKRCSPRMGWTEVLTTAEMRALEGAAMSGGAVTGLELMERAGAAVAGAIRLRWPRPGPVVVLCGPGNNGGDGYVVARHLAQAGWHLRVLGLDNSPRPDAAAMKRRWAAMGAILPLTVDELQRGAGGLCVDAIFGTGLTRAPEGGIAAILAHLGGDASFRERLVAVDCPSGLCLDSGAFLGAPRQPRENDLHARLTVAFDSPKPGHLLERGPACCGELVIADIGLTGLREGGGLRPARLVAVAPAFDIPDARRDGRPWAALDKGRAAHGHKFTHGHALVLAGGVSQGGAARLAARAALRAGAGLVTLAPPGAALIEHAGPPDALMRRGVDDAGALAALLQDRRIGALCLGPGCGVDRAAALLGPLLAAGRPCVLDADALTALAARGGEGLHAACVLTPHGGEFARMFPDLAERLAGLGRIGEGSAQETPGRRRDVSGEERGPLYSKVDAAREAAARSGAVVLLKGPDTVIVAPDGQARIHSAFDVPWLATAGAGDVLAGIIAGLLARGFPPLEAAATGAWLHAAAARRFGPGLIADDLPDQLPGVFRDLGP